MCCIYCGYQMGGHCLEASMTGATGSGKFTCGRCFKSFWLPVDAYGFSR